MTACEEAHKQYDKLAFPHYGLKEGFNLVKQGDPEVIEIALLFLETDPYFHRSGYIKEKLIGYLKKVRFNDRQRKELVASLLTVVKTLNRREFKNYCQLAKAINSGELRRSLRTLTESENPDVAQRARWMFEAINKE